MCTFWHFVCNSSFRTAVATFAVAVVAIVIVVPSKCAIAFQKCYPTKGTLSTLAKRRRRESDGVTVRASKLGVIVHDMREREREGDSER